MGFSPGQFQGGTGVFVQELHWEMGGNHRATLWNHDESKVILDIELKEARKCAEQLLSLVNMGEEDRL